MSAIQSGGWTILSTTTPTGEPKRVAKDNPYISRAEYIQTPEANAIGIDALSPFYLNGQLDKIILRASAFVNRYCDRWFDAQRIDETKQGILIRPMNPQLVTVNLQNAPYQQIESIYIQVLKWFIQIDTSAQSGYLQDFPDYGYYKIVPLLSNAGTGTGSPLPAEIVDRTPLGVLWTRYTFGFGTIETSQALDTISENKSYQAPTGHQLWAPDQTTTIYNAGVAVDPSLYTIDYPNGLVTFSPDLVSPGAITADYTTNESVPFDIKQAVIMLTTLYVGLGQQNPLGFKSLSITAYSVTFGDKEKLSEIKEMLMPYKRNRLAII